MHLIAQFEKSTILNYIMANYMDLIKIIALRQQQKKHFKTQRITRIINNDSLNTNNSLYFA